MSIGLVSVAEDLEWLRATWGTEPDRLSDADVRRGAATLRRLLIDGGQGAIMAAWRRVGFADQPCVEGPDVLALMNQLGRPVEHAVSMIAGGAPVSGIVAVMTGAHRTEHPETGVPPDADEGFAVEVTSITRLASADPPPPGPLNAAIHRCWRLLDYVDSPGAIRRGAVISRRDIIQFICKDAGGVHVDGLFSTARKRTDPQKLAAELNGKVHADWRNGLIYELLSIGFSLGRSADLAQLAAAIRQAA